MKKPKILHAPTTVGGNAHSLSKAEKEMGHDSTSLAISGNYLSYPADKFILNGKENIIVAELKIIIETIRCLFKYDIFHFNFGRSILSQRPFPNKEGFAKWKIFLYTNFYSRFTELMDLRIAHWMGKKTTVTFQGTDGRLYEHSKKYPIHFVHNNNNSAYTPDADKIKKQRIKVIDKYAHQIFAVNPDLFHTLPDRAKFIPYANVDPREWQLVQNNGNKFHVVHAPSNRAVKGTDFILEAVDRLQKEGFDFDFTLVENMPNDEARKIYGSADILIDQLLAGYYGGLAVECMALGKAAICYMREDDLVFMPDDMVKDMPIINAEPTTIYDVLKHTLSQSREDINAIGLKGRQYVEKWHDPLKIAAQMNKAIGL